MFLAYDTPVAGDHCSHGSVGGFGDRSKEEGISAHLCLGKVARSEAPLRQRKATVFCFFSPFLSLFSFIALTKLGTNIKLNIYSIQTSKALKKQRTRTKQKLAVNIQDLFVFLNCCLTLESLFLSLPFPSTRLPLTQLRQKEFWMKNKRWRTMFPNVKNLITKYYGWKSPFYYW